MVCKKDRSYNNYRYKSHRHFGKSGSVLYFVGYVPRGVMWIVPLQASLDTIIFCGRWSTNIPIFCLFVCLFVSILCSSLWKRCWWPRLYVTVIAFAVIRVISAVFLKAGSKAQVMKWMFEAFCDFVLHALGWRHPRPRHFQVKGLSSMKGIGRRLIVDRASFLQLMCFLSGWGP